MVGFLTTNIGMIVLCTSTIGCFIAGFIILQSPPPKPQTGYMRYSKACDRLAKARYEIAAAEVEFNQAEAEYHQPIREKLHGLDHLGYGRRTDGNR